MITKNRNILLFLLIVFCIGIIMASSSIIISNNHIYEAEGLSGKTGQIIEDHDVSGGFYRFFSPNESGFVVFGPYIKLPKGDYFASFRLKTDTKYGSDPITTLDIFSVDIGKINQTNIYAKDFKVLNSYQSFVLPFKSNGIGRFEFRINKSIGNNLWVDSITISPLDSFTVYKSAFTQIMKIIIFIIAGLTIITIIQRPRMNIINSIKKYFHLSINIDMFLFISILFVYTIIVLGLIGQIHGPTGDEPHYLITTNSIIKDGDIYLENNYLNKDYLAFYPNSYIDPHISLDKYGRWLPSHAIGLPILFTVPYFLLGLLGVRLFLVFTATLLVINIFYMVKELLGNEKIAFMTCIFVSLTSPLLFYSHTIYPEMVAGLILVYSTRLLYKIYNLEYISKFKYVLCSLLIAFLPWLGIKYVTLMVPLTVLFLFYNKNEKIKMVIPIIISSFLFMIFMLKTFGTLSPKNFGNFGTMNVSDYFSISNLFSPAKIASYFVDQQVGLIFYAPIYILSLVGMILFVRDIKPKKHFDILLIFLLPTIFYFLMYIISYSWGGGSPIGRPLVAIIPTISLLLSIGLYFFLSKNIRTIIYILCIISLGISFILLENPSDLFNNTSNSSLGSYGKSSLLINIGGPFVDLTKIFPSFLTKDGIDNWIYLFLWIGLFSVLAMIEYIYRLNNINTKKNGISIRANEEIGRG